MPRQIRIESAKGSTFSSIRFTAVIDGTPKQSFVDSFNTMSGQAAARSRLDLKHDWIPETWLDECVLDVRSNLRAATFDVPEEPKPEATAPALFTVTRRRITETTAQGTRYDDASPLRALATAITDARPAGMVADSTLLSWRGCADLAALDVDFHSIPLDARPREADLIELIPEVSPSPSAAWLTKGRGFRFMYARHEAWAADECAAAAVFSIKDRWPGASFEIKGETRLPPGEIHEPVTRNDFSPLRAALSADSEVAQDVVEAWLAENGYRIGDRYPHDRCPHDPSPQGSREPVVVLERGIYCHYCQANSIRWYRSFSSLVGGRTATTVGALVRSLSHWEHARHLVEQATGIEGRVAEQAYRVALKILHGDDPRIEGVFHTHHLIRLNGYWATPDGEGYGKDIGAMLASLPACQNVEAKPIGAKVTRFTQPVDLERDGYPSIVPIWGCRIASVHLEPYDAHVPHAVFHSSDYRSTHREKLRPRYVQEAKRTPTAGDAWSMLEKPFPGIPRRYVELLIAAKGCAEMQSGKPPMIFVDGPSGSSKTASAIIAAAICGDNANEVVWSPQVERFRQAVMSATQLGSFCVINEPLKEGVNAGKGPLAVMDSLLNFTPRSMSHRLYVGAVQLGKLPVFIWTDSAVPQEVVDDKQLARRLVHVSLEDQLFWEQSQSYHGVRNPDAVRLTNESYAAACNSILSDVIDRYFRQRLDFEDIARDLGFLNLSYRNARTAGALLREFYDAVKSATKVKRRDGEWVRIDPAHETPLRELWRQVADPGERDSRKCRGEDWRRLLGTNEQYRFEANHDGRSAFVRFVVGHGTGPADTVELGTGPVEGSADRSRDAIGGGPTESGGEALSIASLDAPFMCGSSLAGRIEAFGNAGLGTVEPNAGLVPIDVR